MLWQKVGTPGIMKSHDDCCMTLSTQVRMWPDSYPLNANRLFQSAWQTEMPHFTSQSYNLPSQLRSPGLHGKTAGSRESEETCCLPDGLRLVGVESDSVMKSVLSRSYMQGPLHVFILIPHRRPLLLPSKDCYIRQTGRRLRVYSLTHAVFFHLIPPATYQASPVPAAWSYTANKLRLSPYPCGACKVANVLGEMGN